MIRRLTTALFAALLLAACGDPDEPGDINSNIEPGEYGALADLDDEGAEGSEPAAMAGAGAAASDASGLTVTNGWVRNPIGGRGMTAGYFTLEGDGEAARLVAAQSPEAERIELHTMAMDGDVMRMRQVEGMDVPANGALTLQSGGDHLMIFGLAPDAAEDDLLDLVLELEDGRRVNAQLPFADSAPEGDAAQQD